MRVSPAAASRVDDRACRAAPRPAWDRTWAQVGQASWSGSAAWLPPFSARAASAWLRPCASASATWSGLASAALLLGLRPAWFRHRRRRRLARSLDLFLLHHLCGRVLDRLRLCDLFDQRLWRFDLGRVLVARGHLREFRHAHDVDRQRLARRRRKRLGRKRQHAPQQHHAVPDRRDGVGLIDPRITRSAPRPLLDLRHQSHAAEAGGRYSPHHLHHRTVVDLPVAAHKDALLRPAARLGDGLELGDQFVQRNFGILEVDLALRVDRDRERFLVLVEASWPGSAADRAARPPSAAAPTP